MLVSGRVASLKLTFSHLKMDATEDDGRCLFGELLLLVSARVIPQKPEVRPLGLPFQWGEGEI